MDRGLLAELRHLLRPLRHAVANSLARAVVRLVDDNKKLQMVQLEVLEGETIDDGERFQQYGFSSTPFPDAEAVVLFPGGDRGRPLVVAVDDRRYRPTGSQPGDVFLYNQNGTLIRIRGSEIRLGSQSAAESAIKGNARDTAEQTFLTAMNTFVTAIVDPAAVPTAAKTAFLAAITAFKTAATSALSAKVKLE